MHSVMQESKELKELKEESNEQKENGKNKRKIVIKPKANVISDNLVETNREYLKEIFTQDELEELKKRYTVDQESREKNIYNFIDAYRCMIKQQFNEETQPSVNHELLNGITVNPDKVKVVWSGCLEALRCLPSESVGHMVTSPPYYNVELYNGTKFRTQEEWNQEFYIPLFTKTYKHLKKGGHYALNVPAEIYESVCLNLFGKADIKIPLKKKAHPKNKLTKKGYNEFIYVWVKG